MKVIIAGSREGVTQEDVDVAVIMSGWDNQITEVVSGRARGADRFGEIWAGRRGIPIKQFPANWNKHGKAAGAIRNQQMAEYGDALVAIWDGKSRGTKIMIDMAEKRGIKVYVYRLDHARA